MLYHYVLYRSIYLLKQITIFSSLYLKNFYLWISVARHKPLFTLTGTISKLFQFNWYTCLLTFTSNYFCHTSLFYNSAPFLESNVFWLEQVNKKNSLSQSNIIVNWFPVNHHWPKKWPFSSDRRFWFHPHCTNVWEQCPLHLTLPSWVIDK